MASFHIFRGCVQMQALLGFVTADSQPMYGEQTIK